MCVEPGGAGPINRAAMIASMAGASVFAFGKVALGSPHATHVPSDLRAVPQAANSSPGALPAERIAQSSARVRAAYSELLAMAAALESPTLRDATIALLKNPVPQYAVRLRTAAARAALRAQLLQAGFIDAMDALDASLPTATHDFGAASQRFMAAAGSGQNSHHAYPGGLVLHELFNARSASDLAHNYDREYFGGRRTINRDVVVAAALYHDVMKTVVFQWDTRGGLSVEPNVAGTGAHHILSAAEAIVRGHDARFVTVVLCAHAAPSLGEEVKVVAWARAAAMVAGIDPVDFGLLKRTFDGFALATAPPIEAFISNLSDHDYVLSVHAMHEVHPRVDAAIAAGKVTGTKRLWYRNALLARTSAIGLYGLLVRDEAAFRERIERELSTLSA